MRPFMIPCLFGEERIIFPLYIGEPVPGFHPLAQQAAWLLRERGGVIPTDVMDSFARLQSIALEYQVSFEELCVSALENATAEANEPTSSEPAPDGATGTA